MARFPVQTCDDANMSMRTQSTTCTTISTVPHTYAVSLYHCQLFPLAYPCPFVNTIETTIATITKPKRPHQINLSFLLVTQYSQLPKRFNQYLQFRKRCDSCVRPSSVSSGRCWRLNMRAKKPRLRRGRVGSSVGKISRSSFALKSGFE
jgi:hypothetical protein